MTTGQLEVGVAEKSYLPWREFYALIDALAEELSKHVLPPEYTKVYGIPRGGVPVAVSLASILNMQCVGVEEISCKDTLIVDDICDSGKTLSPFVEAGYLTATLDIKKNASVTPTAYCREVNSWVVYPWEEEGENAFEDYVVRLFEYVGEDPNREGLVGTPRRVRKAFDEIFGGYKTDPASLLKTTFASHGDQMIVVSPIQFYSTCEHHLLPFYGVAHVGYVPNERVIGLSKIPRVVDCFAKRMQIQERMTSDIADILWNGLEPQGVGVILQATHLCMACRGVRKPGSVMTTSGMRGLFLESQDARQEFLTLCGLK